MTDGLTLRRLTLAYGRLTVLREFDLPAIASGKVVGVLGANAAGKSTLLRALAGLVPYRGEAHLDGRSIAGMGHRARAGLVGYLPQALPHGSTLVAYEAVVSAFRAVRGDLSRSAVDRAVEDVFDRLGIRHLAFRPLGRMSGGQRQMVGLAQVIVRRPRLMLLDEPTSALDLRWQLIVLRTVREIVATEAGIGLIALHDINLALRHCDRIVLLGGGELIACGAPREAITPESLRRAYGIDARVERGSDGIPIVLADDIDRTGLEQSRATV